MEGCDLRFKRVLLKISGEALMGAQGYGIDSQAVLRIAEEIKAVYELGVQLCLVIGGGNIFRGINADKSMERTTADHMGMLATIMNALAFQSALEGMNIPTRVQSAVPMNTICEPYIRRRAMRHMEKGRIVIFAAGTGNPFFTTDSGAALRAAEMDCQALFKGTKVDGVYDKDPMKYKDAKRYQQLSYQDSIAHNLQVMDVSAFSICRDKKMPIIVFSIFEKSEFASIMKGGGHFTLIHE